MTLKYKLNWRHNSLILFHNCRLRNSYRNLSANCQLRNASMAQNDISNSQKKGEEHPFNFTYAKKSKIKIAEELKSQELYNEDGLIAINKPYGLRISSLPQSKLSQSTNHHQGYYEGMPTFEDLLPILNEMYCADLKLASSPERWSSGILLLATSQKMYEKVKKCFERSLQMGLPRRGYLTITVGSPNPSSFDKKVLLKFEKTKDDKKVPIICEKYSKNQVKGGEVKVNIVRHYILDTSDSGASLVNIDLFRIPHHFLRIWMSHCLSPILGDFIYGRRVRTIMGQPVACNPTTAAAFLPPKIPPVILNDLGLKDKSPEIIPCLLHQSKIFLRMFHGKKSGDLIIGAPPPHHFRWTCDRLRLKIPEDESFSHS